MTKSAFISALLARGFSVSDFNTCNAWGFGGGIGQAFTSGTPGVVIKVFTAYYRHLPPAKVVVVGEIDAQGGQRRVFDELQSGKAFKRVLELVPA